MPTIVFNYPRPLTSRADGVRASYTQNVIND